MDCEPARIGSRTCHRSPRPQPRRPLVLRCHRGPRRRNRRTRCLRSRPARLRRRCAVRAPCRQPPPTPRLPRHRWPSSSRGIVLWDRLTSCSTVHRCRGADPGSGFWTESCAPPLDGTTGCGGPNQPAGLEAVRIRHSLAGDRTDVSSRIGRRQSRAVRELGLTRCGCIFAALSPGHGWLLRERRDGVRAGRNLGDGSATPVSHAGAVSDCVDRAHYRVP